MDPNTLSYHNITTSFSVKDQQWSVFIQKNQDEIIKIIYKTFEICGFLRNMTQEAVIDFHLVDNQEIHTLNHQWRQKDKPTNVLSFPSFTPSEFQEECFLQHEIVYFGDIIIAYAYCKKEAKTINLSFREHIYHMIIHGMLHLLGYDHDTTEAAETMETLEINILQEFGFASPY